MRGVLRLAIPIVLLVLSMWKFGVEATLLTILMLTGILSIAIILGHIVSKGLVITYKWDVGRRLNDLWRSANEVEDYSTAASLAVAMLYARTALLIAILLGLILLAGMLLPGTSFGQIPPRAYQYLPVLIEEHQAVWPESDLTIIARQIQQESNWKVTATRRESSGATSYGAMQVLETTWGEIKTKHPTLLDGDPVRMLQARWGFRAGLLYDRMMWESSGFAETILDRYCFMLASYNGGQGWVKRDRELASVAGKNKNVWFGNVELHSHRAESNFDINRRYVREIMDGAKNYSALVGTGRCGKCHP